MTTSINKVQRISGVLFMTLLFTLINALLTQAAFAAILDWEVVPGATVEQGSRFYDKSSGYYTYNKITNSTGAGLNGPLRLVVVNSTHAVLNADGIDDAGKPYFNALSESGALASSETGAPIRINFANKRGAFSYSTIVQQTKNSPTASISIDTVPNDLKFLQGQTQNIATVLNFTTTTSGIPYTVNVSQTVSPSEGLSFSPPVDGTTYTPSVNFGTILNQGITAVSPGVYEITTTATIYETGQTSTTKAKVTVTSGQETSLIVNEPGSDPGALALDTATPVTFTVQIQGEDLNKVKTVTLFDITTGSSLILNDEGQEGDLDAVDGTYSGKTVVDTNGMLAQQCHSFKVIATTENEDIASSIYKLCTTSFPIGTKPSDLTLLVTDPITGQEAIANEVLVGFVSGTTEGRIKSIFATINGTVVGTIPGIGVYQVRLNQPVNASTQLTAIINTLRSNTEVRFAEAAVIDSVNTVVPKDDKFAKQTGLKKIRADEAWYIARGKVNIAIVDSGVDLTHDDLKNKIFGHGWDFGDDDNDPTDNFGHGTLVAGIAAAEANNTIGIAGVSWGSKILVVKISDSSGDASPQNTAAGIKWAADNGIRIISVSYGSSGGNESTKCEAVTYAQSKGSLVIAAAGNNSSSTKFYPAACPGVIAVGNTKLDDTRMPNPQGSNYGSWVDLAAPGENVWSTVPTGTCPFCDPTGYRLLANGGTSSATPMVSGAAAVLLSRVALTNVQLEERLKVTAQKLDPTLQLGAGRIDLFEAVFNGSFEEKNMASWKTQGTASSIDRLGSIKPQDRTRMGYVSTGPSADQVSGSITQTFQVQPGVTKIPVSFMYAFLSEEFPEYVGSQFNDAMSITLQAPDGTKIPLASEEINSSTYSMIDSVNFMDGDDTVGWTGWKIVSAEIPVTAGAGSYRLFITDAGDDIFDTVVLIDCIQFRTYENMICKPAP